jgi:AcrR family transcriptional regulator
MLLDAAFELLGSEGWSATTVRGVCRRAHLHPRYFYQAFSDLDDLLVAVFDRVVGQLGATMTLAVRAAPREPPLQMRAGLAAVAHFVADDRRRAQILYTEAPGQARLNRRRADAMQAFAEDVGARSLGVDPTAMVAAHLTVGGFTAALVAWLDGRLVLPLDDLVETAATLLAQMLPGR